jgi:hypothetical protein
MIPAGSLTGDQEIVNGTVTEAPFAGPRGEGAGGPEELVGVGVGVGVLRRARVGCAWNPAAMQIKRKTKNGKAMREDLMTYLLCW